MESIYIVRSFSRQDLIEIFDFDPAAVAAIPDEALQAIAETLGDFQRLDYLDVLGRLVKAII